MCQRDREAAGRNGLSGITSELRESYTRAIYRVDFVSGPIFLRCGEPCPDIVDALTALGATQFAFLSAANPGSVVLSDADNERRHGWLVERLQALGRTAIPGESSAADGGWREASLLVPGLEREAAQALAREFGQVALLWGAVGGLVELLPAEAVGPMRAGRETESG